MLAVLERRLWLVWGWSLSGFGVVLQSSLLDGVAFDPFSFQEDSPVWCAGERCSMRRASCHGDRDLGETRPAEPLRPGACRRSCGLGHLTFQQLDRKHE